MHDLPQHKSSAFAHLHHHSPLSGATSTWRVGHNRSISSIVSVFALLSLFVFVAVFLSDDARVPYYTHFKRTQHPHPQSKTQTQTQHPHVVSPTFNNQPPTSPPVPHCSLLTDPHVRPVPYRFNIRTFCKLPTLCIQPNNYDPSSSVSSSLPNPIYVSSPLSLKPKCLFRQPSLLPYPHQRFVNCTYVHHHVLCAHGIYNYNAGQPVCPPQLPLSQMPSSLRHSARWLDGVAVIVPAYKFMGNIYHYAFASLTSTHIVSALPALFSSSSFDPAPLPNKVTLLFRGELPESLGVWQKGLLDMLVRHRLQKLGMQVVVESLFENLKSPSAPVTCVNHAVVLGRRFAVAIWPFPNVTAVHPDSPVLPIESLALRRTAYDAIGMPSRLPSLPAGALSSPSPPKRIIIDLPPRAVGYSRRNSLPDPDVSKGEYISGNIRRFSDADEEWFVHMVREEAYGMNFTYHVLQTEKQTPMSEQIRLYARVGVIVGIHGANFMNAVFSPPFSAMLEVTRVDSICYKSGANSGLYYARYSPLREASMVESGCPPRHRKCATDLRSRRVMIGEPEDRTVLRRMVREQMDRIDRLHIRFASMGGLPVVYDEATSTYGIDWESAPSR